MISLGKKYIEDNYIEEVSEERAIELSMNELQLMGITNCDQVYDNDSIFDNPVYPSNAELYDGFCDEHGFDTMKYFLFVARRIELKNEESEVEEDIATTKKYIIWGNGSTQLNSTKLAVGQQVRIDLYNMNIDEVTELNGLTYVEFTEGHTEEREEGTYTRMYIEITGIKNVSAKLERTGKTEESQTAYYTITVNNEDMAYTLRDRLIEACGYIGLESDDCEAEEENGKWIVAVGLPYEHGRMKEYDSDIKREFKSIKKELKIK